MVKKFIYIVSLLIPLLVSGVAYAEHTNDMLMNGSGAADIHSGVGTKIYKEYADSVVLIITDEGFGSGSVIDNNGTVLTNFHVIEGQDTVGVVFRPSSGQVDKDTPVYKASIIRINEIADLALIKVINFPKVINPIQIASLEDVEIGSEVHAIGHPTGETWTYTQGIVSQIRSGYEWNYMDTYKHSATIIQTQTPISPGNSGGPLLNDDGKLIGVNSFISTQGQGINYAVSSKDVMAFLNSDSNRLAEHSYPKCKQRKKRVPEGWGFDLNCDGKIDTILVDKNHSGNVEYIIRDSHFNGIADMRITRSKKDGPFDFLFIATKRKNIADVCAKDNVGDLMPHVYVDCPPGQHVILDNK